MHVLRENNELMSFCYQESRNIRPSLELKSYKSLLITIYRNEGA